MSETYYALTDLIKLTDNLIAAMPSSYASGILAVRNQIGGLPEADVRPMAHGRWKRHVLKSANVPWGYDCSACGEWIVIGEDYIAKEKFCRNCGAKMEADNG